jgi:putative oxidoreductase
MSEAQTMTRLIIPALAPLYGKLSGLSYPIIRFFTGLMAMPHGAQKLFGWFGGDIQGTAGFFSQIGLEPALPLAYLVRRHRHRHPDGHCRLQGASGQRVLLD